MTDTGFYRAFEDRYRGSRELIKARLKAYLPFIEPLKTIYPAGATVDLGCGRGEWLELMVENKFAAYGVDLDEGMLADCARRKLATAQQDALACLQGLPDNSQVIVSGFHIAEHIPFDNLQRLVQDALRVLKPGGLLILETPNPENLVVGTVSFYLDPSHERPIPPQLLSFLTEYNGFSRSKIIRLHDSEDLKDAQNIQLFHVINGVSPDFAIVAQKQGDAKQLALFDSAFTAEYGLTLENLSWQYESLLQKRISETEAKSALIVEKERSQWLQNGWDAAKERLEQVARELGAASAYAENLQNQLLDRNQVLAHQEKILGQQQVQNQNLQNESNAAQASLEQLKKERVAIQAYQEQLNDELRANQAQLTEKNALLAHRESALAEHQTHYLQLQSEYDIAKAEIDNLRPALAHWQNEAHRLNGELQWVYRSKSWRITWPLRKLMQFLKWLFFFPLWLLRLPKRTMRWLLVRMLAWSLKHPKLKNCTLHYLHRHPRLHSLAQARGLVSTANPTSEPAPPPETAETAILRTNLSHMTPRAQRLYTDLRAVTDKNQEIR